MPRDGLKGCRRYDAITGRSGSISRSLSHALLSKPEFNRHKPTDMREGALTDT